MEFLLPVLLALLVITQIILPLFVPSLPFFWLFTHGGTKHIATSDENEVPQQSKPEHKKTGLDESVEEIADQLSKETEQLKNTKGKVDETIEKLNSAKNKSLNNLNNNDQK
jgi:hypothetical protein